MTLAELLDAVAKAESDVVSGNLRIDTPLLRAEGIRYLARLFSAGALTQIEAGDPAYPQLVPFVSPWVTWGGTNPDSDYLYATVSPEFTYRLRGRRGAVHLLAFETFSGDFDDMAAVAACDMRLDVSGGPGNIEFGADGAFEIVLSATPPEENRNTGNWLRIPDVPGHLLVRYCWYDWDEPDRPWVTIVRDGAEYPPPRPTVAAIDRRLDRFAGFLREGPQMCALAAAMYFSRDPGAVEFPPWSLHGDTDIDGQLSFKDQLYGQSHFTLRADEALLLEVPLPASPYWSVNLSSPYLENTDWHLRQNSVNGHQAVVDADGVFRAVVSSADPGVPNWLDTGGQATGIIQSRFLLPSAPPEITLRTLPLSEVRSVLPASTPVVTPAERHEAVLRRVLAVQRRAQG
jgi:hypothetical protein